MDGATVCVPNGAPNCEACPWKTFCSAGLEGSYDRLPVKSKAKARKIEHRTILLIRDGEHVAIKAVERLCWQDCMNFPIIWQNIQKRKHWKKYGSCICIHRASANFRMQMPHFFPCGMAYAGLYDTGGYPDP